jgi:hypothetical protein
MKKGSVEQLGLFSSQAQPEAKEAASFSVRRSVNLKAIEWVAPSLLSDHPLNVKLFGGERLLNVDDLVLAMSSGYDISRAIKCVRRPDGRLIIIDGHRRKRAAEIIHCRVPVIVQHLESEADELEEMIMSNLVRNRSYKTCGLGTAVRLIQMVKPRNVKRGRPPKKNQAPKARISKPSKRVGAKIIQTTDAANRGELGGIETRRAYYASLLGISEKRFRLVVYILEYGSDGEKREVDFGPRKLNVIYKAVRARITGEDEKNGQNPRVVARTARAALRATTSLFSLLGTEPSIEEIELGMNSLASLAKAEFAGAKPKGATAAYVLELYRKLLTQNLEGTEIASE